MRKPLLILTGTLLLLGCVFISQFGVYRFIEEMGLPESFSPLVYPPSVFVLASPLLIFLGLAFLCGVMGWKFLKEAGGFGAEPARERSANPKFGHIHLVLLGLVAMTCAQLVLGRGNLALWYTAVQKKNQEVFRKEKYVRDHLAIDPETTSVVYFQGGKSCYGIQEFWMGRYDLHKGIEVPIPHWQENQKSDQKEPGDGKKGRLVWIPNSPDGEGGREIFVDDSSGSYFSHSVSKDKLALKSIACSGEGNQIAVIFQTSNKTDLVRLNGFGKIANQIFSVEHQGEPASFAINKLAQNGTRAWIKRNPARSPEQYYTVELWDLEQAKSLGNWDLPKNSLIGSDGDGNFLYLLQTSEQGGSGKIRVLDSTNGREIHAGILQHIPASLSQSGKLTGSPDGKSFVYGAEFKVNLVQFGEGDKPAMIKVFEAPGQVRALQFGSDGKTVAVFSRKKLDKEWLLDSQDATIQLLQVATGEQNAIPFQVKPTQYENEINFDDDLTYLTFRVPGAIHRHEVATGRELIKGKDWK